MKCVIAAIDFSDTTGEVIETAVTLARGFGGCLRILHTEDLEAGLEKFEDSPDFVRQPKAQEIVQRKHCILEMERQLRAEGLDCTCHVLMGSPVEKLIEQAHRYRAYCIVVGSHAHGALHHLFFGSTREELIRLAPCPVMVVPPLGEDSNPLHLPMIATPKRFGELLIEKGYATAEQIDDAMKAKQSPEEMRKLGHILLSRGQVTIAQLDECIDEQNRMVREAHDLAEEGRHGHGEPTR